jgi:hypothetical protein
MDKKNSKPDSGLAQKGKSGGLLETQNNNKIFLSNLETIS